MSVKGISLHIGVNVVDPEHYCGWTGDLQGAELDAANLRKIAQKEGYDSYILSGRTATSQAVSEKLSWAAEQLVAGDIFLASFSGFSGEVPDTNSDEDLDRNRVDVTWALYDRQFADDEYWVALAAFKAGVRVVLTIDSSRSGTVLREIPAFVPGPSESAARIKAMPSTVSRRVYREHSRLYANIQRETPSMEISPLRASAIILNACQDNQVALDGKSGGLFTNTLIKVYNRGSFKGGYRDFRNDVVARMPPTQSPNYLFLGKPSKLFESQRAFSI